MSNTLPYLSILLPIGLSFHTFQAMSYTIEVYRGNQKAEKHLGIYSLYVMFYPQLVAGPIERPQNLLYQFKTEHPYKYENVATGLKLMLWGIFKKVIIADRLAPFVSQVFDHQGDHVGFPVLISFFFFAIQIYCDFSGYSDIAIGSAKTMGFDLMRNFNLPYFSKSVSEFWKRWHISLSTWFKDYLYIPLGGNRKKWSRNIFVTFLVSGFWHGANGTYIAWGAIHGWIIIAESHLKKLMPKFLKQNKIYPILQGILVFMIVTSAWVFFRASNISVALQLLFDSLKLSKEQLGLYLYGSYTDYINLILAFIFIGLLFAIELYMNLKKPKSFIVDSWPKYLRWTFYFFATMFLFFFCILNSNSFIYFQF